MAKFSKKNQKPKKAKSATKVTNKNFNKLVKRGKAKPKSSSPFVQSRKNKSTQKAKFGKFQNDYDTEEVEVDDVLDMLPKSEQKKLKDYVPQRKRNIDSSEDESDLEEYEKRPRLGFTLDNKPSTNVTHIKHDELNNVDGEDSQPDVLDDINGSEEADEQDDEIENMEVVNEKVVEEESFLESLNRRVKRISDIKIHVGNLATSVISHPEKNMKKLKELILLLDLKENSNSYKLAFITIQKITAFATLEVFKDIIPNYRVVESGKHVDEKKRLKKETKLLWDFERTLVQLYKLYLRRMDRMVNCIRKVSSLASNFYAEIVDAQEAKEKLAVIGLKCLSDLLLTHPHFNCRDEIIQIIVNSSLSKVTALSDLACDTLCKLYKQDKSGEVSLAAVKITSKAIKAAGFSVNPKLIATYLSLKIKEVKKKGDDKKDMKVVRGKLERMSRKERKRNKAMQKLENQLLETEGEENQKKKLDRHTEIITQIFATYFRILKFNFNNSDNEQFKEKFKIVLTPVLEGLSKFAHLINIEFFDNIISLLYNFMKADILNCYQSLHCLKTVFVILSGEGSALNIDPQRFYAHLYEQLKFIDHNSSDDALFTLFDCIDSMIIKRRKELSLKRALAFVKRLATLTLNCDEATCSSLLNLITSIMQNFKQSDILLDTEKCGSGIYLPDASDPEFSNANSATVWELHLLSKHHQNSIRQRSLFVLNGCKREQKKQISRTESAKEAFLKSKYSQSLFAA